MNDSSSFVDSFLTEIRASLSQSGGDAVLRRINAERLLRLLADEFVETHQAERVRILPDARVAGEPGADFLIQVDDYDIRLQIVDAPEGQPVLSTDQLPALLDLLGDNPSTVALVLVWTTDDLLAMALTTTRIRYLQTHPERLRALLREAEPLPAVLRNLVARQVKLWEVALSQPHAGAGRSANVRELFQHEMRSAINSERQRSYRFPERKEAAERYPVAAEMKVIQEVLDQTLAGASAGDIQSRLLRPPRRGSS